MNQTGINSVLTRTLQGLGKDGKLVIVASALRSLDYGFISVYLGIYLSLLSLTAFQAGIIFSAIMAGGALSNAVASWKGDSIGRRRILIIMAGFMGLGGILYPFSTDVIGLSLISLIAMTTSTGGDRTAFLSIDMTILSEVTEPKKRTATFAWYNLIGRLTKAIGSLLIVTPTLLQHWCNIGELDSFKAMFWVYSGLAFSGIAVYFLLSPKAENQRINSGEKKVPMLPRTRKVMAQLTALFSLDALGGGFMVNGFISYWFATKFGMSLQSMAVLFFLGQVFNTISIAFATPLARRIGLISTMAYSQTVANGLMIFMAISDNHWLAITFFLCRELANDMDIPTRQSYSMAIVPPEDRTATAGITNLGRTLAQTVSPGMAGFFAEAVFLSTPIIIGSTIKLIYNAVLFVTFKSLKAPEEEIAN